MATNYAVHKMKLELRWAGEIGPVGLFEAIAEALKPVCREAQIVSIEAEDGGTLQGTLVVYQPTEKEEVVEQEEVEEPTLPEVNV